MESDSTLAWLALAVSMASFSLVTLVEASLASVKRERVQWLVAQGVRGAAALDWFSSSPVGLAGALSPVRHLLLASSLLSGMALSIASWGAGWWPVLPGGPVDHRASGRHTHHGQGPGLFPWRARRAPGRSIGAGAFQRAQAVARGREQDHPAVSACGRRPCQRSDRWHSRRSCPCQSAPMESPWTSARSE